MRVAHLIQRYWPAIGGAETWCRELALLQAARGDRVRVLTLDIVHEREFWSEPEGSGERFRLGRLDLDGAVEVRRFHRTLPVWTLHHAVLDVVLNRAADVFWLGPHSAEMLGGLDAEVRQADLLHLHALPYPHVGLGLAAARRAGRPVVITPHFHAGHRDYERPHQFRRLRGADAVIALSGHERDVLVNRGVPAGRVSIAGCGLPSSWSLADEAFRNRCRRALEERLGTPVPGARIVCLARRMREKGIDTLVQAVGLLIARGRDVTLVLAGPTHPWWPGFLAAQPPAVRARIVDAGTLPDDAVPELLAGCDVFAMPSRWEAFGIVFLQAWAAGLPVVAGDAGAQPEIVGGGGAAVSPESPDAVARALALFLDEPETARRAVQDGRERLRARWTAEGVGDVVGDVYRRVLDLRGGKNRSA